MKIFGSEAKRPLEHEFPAYFSHKKRYSYKDITKTDVFFNKIRNSPDVANRGN